MRVIHTIAIFGTTLALAACGSQSKKDDANNDAPKLTAEDKAELDKEFASVPPATIVRVPVDAQGNPTGEPEMRVVENGDAPESDVAITSAWTEGQAPEALVDSTEELDEDSSTQSWQSWGAGRCGGSSYGNGCGNNYYGGYGSNYWNNTYRPTLYRRGYRWNYNRGYNCRVGGYQYYAYSSNRYW